MDERELIQQITREVLRELHAAGLVDASGKLIDTAVAAGSVNTRSYISTHVAAKKPLLLLPERYLQQSVQNELVELSPYADNLQLWIEGDGELTSLIPTSLRANLVRGGREDELNELLQRTSLIVMPWVPLPILSRLVHLEPECPSSLLLTQALLKGMKVRARKRLLGPELDLYRHHDPSPILRRVQGLIREGQQMGVEWVKKGAISELFTAIPEPIDPGKKRLLTAADVRALKEVGEIVLPKGTIITPLARDEIKRYGLRIRMD